MRGDFSRIRFDRGRHYTGVLEQQGRVALDADANEQFFIDEYQSRTGLIDSVGQFGGPAGDAGFQVSVSGSEILIGPGRYYVNGLLCANPASLSYDAQPYLISPATAPDAGALLSGLTEGTAIQVWLQVWQRLQTVLDDPDLREPALGRADTAARLQTVWRVVASPVAAPAAPAGAAGAAPSCCQQMYAQAPAPPAGAMTALTAGPAESCGCQPVAAAGYQGLENQLYRVEIHDGGAADGPTFKWSRENGSVVTAVTGISGSTVTVSSLGPDANLGFQAGQWVELTDDTLEFGPAPNQPGTLYLIQSVQQAQLSVTLAVPAGQAITVDPGRNARLRRWDQAGPAATADGIALAAGTWLPLENGIQVSFTDGTFTSGDYWTIPARTATGQIEWPSGGNGNAARPPDGIPVYSAPLACLHPLPAAPPAGGAAGTPAPGVLVEDCRRTFSPLTTISPPVTARAAHVTAISWVNDDVMTLDALIASGLTITLDQAPTGPLSGANVVVTVELAMAAAVDNLNLPVISDNPKAPGASVTNLRDVTVIDTTVALDGAAITWQLPMSTELQFILLQNLNTYVYQGAPAQQWARVRVRLLGAMIYAAGNGGVTYLDGRALGLPAVRSDGTTPRVDLQLPSGAGAPASDFEGWFYVAPILQATTVTPSYPAVTVIPARLGGVAGVSATGTPGAVDLTAEITVSYPPIAAVTVTIGLTGTTGVGNIVTMPASAAIPAGQTTVTVPISVVGNPGAGTTLSFNVSATVPMLTGGSLLANGTFTVTGVAPPPLPVLGNPLGGPPSPIAS
jgi:Family of unknown function (DUF6519)